MMTPRALRTLVILLPLGGLCWWAIYLGVAWVLCAVISGACS